MFTLAIEAQVGERKMGPSGLTLCGKLCSVACLMLSKYVIKDDRNTYIPILRLVDSGISSLILE